MKTMMSILALFVCQLGISQIELALPEYNVVYRGYDNCFKIGAGAETAFLELESQEAEVFRTDSCFIVRPSGSYKTITVLARNFKDKQVVKTWQFRVMNLPVPNVYWGNYLDGTEVGLEEKQVRVDYDGNSIFESAGFEVLSYTVSSVAIANPLSPVTGSAITTEVVDALKKAKAASKGKSVPFTLTVQAKGKNGIIRKLTAEFKY
ncbi:hypothetical protein D3C87_41070 [compost metagenome]